VHEAMIGRLSTLTHSSGFDACDERILAVMSPLVQWTVCGWAKPGVRSTDGGGRIAIAEIRSKRRSGDSSAASVRGTSALDSSDLAERTSVLRLRSGSGSAIER